ncbi:hypothetical protein GCM10018777_10470 [Streptomyces albogriseolus]|uniref:hypothetical protein n=1 Tax=Streptomyces albogriseolus TaxID=1887 RepID=UPI001673EC40|nr:hypothetical protein [Streptomyces viridodiastaticus]MCX4570706.1 hypothetical protein [Streptomyces viridodiastaticus]GHG01713.1 hypothetical protein GCM10018777_10470 [Streptomyces viridodiastaticus]
MGSLRQHTARGTWWTTRIAALCPALAVLLAALVICLGAVAHGQSTPATASMTTMSATAAPTDTPAEHHATTAAHPSDCLPGDVCCRPADGVRAVLATPSQPLPAVLPRMPDLPRQPDTPALSTGPASACLAPDLHVLQVQRT